MSLVKLYPDDFSKDDMRDLSHQLHLYIADVRADNRFSNINTIGELSQKMVEIGKHCLYRLVYRLLKFTSVACRNNNSWEMLFGPEDCKNEFV